MIAVLAVSLAMWIGVIVFAPAWVCWAILGTGLLLFSAALGGLRYGGAP